MIRGVFMAATIDKKANVNREERKTKIEEVEQEKKAVSELSLDQIAQLELNLCAFKHRGEIEKAGLSDYVAQEECITGFERATPVVPVFDHWVKTYEAWNKREGAKPTDPKYLDPRAAAAALHLDSEAVRREEVIMSIRSIIETRMAWNEATLDYFQNKPLLKNTEFEKYLKDVYGITQKMGPSFSPAIQFNDEGLIEMARSNIAGYQEVLTNFDGILYEDTFCLEMAYDLLFSFYLQMKKAAPRLLIEEMETRKTAYEAGNYKAFLEILKPFISPNYKKFKERFFTKEGAVPIEETVKVFNAYFKELLDENTVVASFVQENAKYCLESSYLENLRKIRDEYLKYSEKVKTDPSKIAKNDPDRAYKLFRLRKEIFYDCYDNAIQVKNIKEKLKETVAAKVAEEKAKRKAEEAAKKTTQKAKVVVHKKSVPEIPPAVDLDSSSIPLFGENRQKDQEKLERIMQDFQVIQRRERDAEKVRAYNEFVDRQRAINRQIETEKRKLSIKLSMRRSERKEEKESAEMDSIEVERLLHLNHAIKAHQIVFDAIFDGGDFTCTQLESFIKALFANFVDKPSNLFEFNGSSHFKAFVPNTNVSWDKNTAGLYTISRSQMSKIDSWRFHGGDRMEIFTKKGRKKVLDGFIHAGITPERLRRAMEFNTIRVASASPR